MAQINVTINGRSFRMACDDGEEERLHALAARFDDWITELRSAFGEIGDQRLTVMAGIMATDQLAEMEKKVARLEGELLAARRDSETSNDQLQSRDAEAAAALDQVAGRIEALAHGLSKSLKPS
ncbi:cell division protein ZapA [Roseibium sp. CAU 1637]|uniref:Cell division protein ZapA n=1 Tax=Roseibium limicola TaxID=2816037 RepID=A0A939ETN8_9HYPH|nr:cell division protein ZapA [Roseibium limicola]MBO0346924.1 cell division protein ZapA [Roseibium limicola]